MGYLGFRFRGSGLNIMLCLGSYVFYELQEPDFMFLASRRGNNLGGPNFLKKKYSSKFFVARIKKILAIMSQKLLYRLCISKQKN